MPMGMAKINNGDNAKHWRGDKTLPPSRGTVGGTVALGNAWAGPASAPRPARRSRASVPGKRRLAPTRRWLLTMSTAALSVIAANEREPPGVFPGAGCTSCGPHSAQEGTTSHQTGPQSPE